MKRVAQNNRVFRKQFTPLHSNTLALGAALAGELEGSEGFKPGGQAMDEIRRITLRRFRRSLIGMSVAAIAALGMAGPAAAGHTVVFTEDGPVKGTETAEVREFLGIPYAAAPVGDLRWRPPVAHARWFAPLDAKK